MEIGRSERGNWIETAFSGIFPYQDDTNSESVSGVKIKTVLVKSNIFFQDFTPFTDRLSFLRGQRLCKALLNKGFKLFVGGPEGFFFFSVEPPFGCRFLHEGIDMPHAHQVPEAFQFATERRLQRP